jgi:hypothetical protein
VRDGNNAKHTMTITTYTQMFLAEAAHAAPAPCVPSWLEDRRSNDVPALAGRYAR